MKNTNIKTVSLLIITSILLGVLSICGVSASLVQKKDYKEAVLELLKFGESDRGELTYEELFRYYGNKTTSDETTPDYVMVLVHDNPVPDILVHSYIEDYIVITGSYSPYIHGYCFYVPSENRFYTLEEAINSNLHGNEEALKSISHSVAIVGDCDSNFELNVKDATCIQKRIAQLDTPVCALSDYDYLVYDFDRDEEVNIKDATAIQKHIAGIAY